MKTQSQCDDFIREIKLTCVRHGISMIATCAGEGIYGEIYLFEPENAKNDDWKELNENAFNFDFDTILGKRQP